MELLTVALKMIKYNKPVNACAKIFTRLLRNRTSSTYMSAHFYPLYLDSDPIGFQARGEKQCPENGNCMPCEATELVQSLKPCWHLAGILSEPCRKKKFAGVWSLTGTMYPCWRFPGDFLEPCFAANCQSSSWSLSLETLSGRNLVGSLAQPLLCRWDVCFPPSVAWLWGWKRVRSECFSAGRNHQQPSATLHKRFDRLHWKPYAATAVGLKTGQIFLAVGVALCD